MVERKETTVSCIQFGEKEEYLVSETQGKQPCIQSSYHEKLPSFQSLDCWLHTTEEAKDSARQRLESEQRNIPVLAETYASKSMPLEQLGDCKLSKKPNSNGVTSNADQLVSSIQQERMFVSTHRNSTRKQDSRDYSTQENDMNNLEENVMQWRKETNLIQHIPNKRQRISHVDSFNWRSSEDGNRDKEGRSLSSSSGSFENNRKEMMDSIPFDIHEAERYTNSKPHLSAAALQCATLAASELQSELKATEELLNSAARRRRYMNYWSKPGANINVDATHEQLCNWNTGGDAFERKPTHDNGCLGILSNVTNDPVNASNVIPLEVPMMHSSPCIGNVVDNVSLPETNSPVTWKGSSSVTETTPTKNIIEDVVKRLAVAESELREIRSKNRALEREREVLLIENESLRKQLKRFS